MQTSACAQVRCLNTTFGQSAHTQVSCSSFCTGSTKMLHSQWCLCPSAKPEHQVWTGPKKKTWRTSHRSLKSCKAVTFSTIPRLTHKVVGFHTFLTFGEKFLYHWQTHGEYRLWTNTKSHNTPICSSVIYCMYSIQHLNNLRTQCWKGASDDQAKRSFQLIEFLVFLIIFTFAFHLSFNEPIRT